MGFVPLRARVAVPKELLPATAAPDAVAKPWSVPPLTVQIPVTVFAPPPAAVLITRVTPEPETATEFALSITRPCRLSGALEGLKPAEPVIVVVPANTAL